VPEFIHSEVFANIRICIEFVSIQLRKYFLALWFANLENKLLFRDKC